MPGIRGSVAANSDPASNAVVVVPSDTVVFSLGGCRALYVGTTGNITALMASDGQGQAAILFSNVPVGIFPVSCLRVNSTGTTASNLVALY